MKWVLIYVALTAHGHPIATEYGRFDTMNECFYAREKLALKKGSVDGYYPKGTQAVCIRFEKLEND